MISDRRFLFNVAAGCALALLLVQGLGGDNLRSDLCQIRYQRGLTAEAADQPISAFSNYLILEAISPGYQDVPARLARLFSRAPFESLGQLEPIARVAAIRWLAGTGRWAQLAPLLDQEEVWIPAGSFRMGEDRGPENQKPAHAVYLDAFFIDRFEVTNAQYRRFVQATGTAVPVYWGDTGFPSGTADHPVVGVSWEQARAYCAWADKRLPTEAEWEKACRSESGFLYPWGDRWVSENANTGLQHADSFPSGIEFAWFYLSQPGVNFDLGLQAVGSYPTGISLYGVHDLVGNASEWVADWYNWSGYAGQPGSNPIGDGPPWNHVVRGSSWFVLVGNAQLIPANSLCSYRSSSHSYDDPRVGFRCARSSD